MSPSIVSLFTFLLLVISLHMFEAFGAQTEIRKLKETTKTRRSLEGKNYKSSKMWTPPSITRRCGGRLKFENKTTTYRPDWFDPFHGDSSPYLCDYCESEDYCYVVRCITTRSCESSNGSPETCHVSQKCDRCGNLIPPPGKN